MKWRLGPAGAPPRSSRAGTRLAALEADEPKVLIPEEQVVEPVPQLVDLLRQLPLVDGRGGGVDLRQPLLVVELAQVEPFDALEAGLLVE